MEKEKLIKLSTRFKKTFRNYDSASQLFKVLTKDSVFSSLPLGIKDKIYISFLIVNTKTNSANYLSKLYDKIERSLFKSEIIIIEEKDADGTCEICGGSGQYDCDECSGTGQIDCDECLGDGCDECNNEGVIYCDTCEEIGLVNCDECYGEGEVEVSGSAMISTVTLYSFNPNIFNSLELINNKEKIINDNIYDDMLINKLSCIIYLENDDYEFIESDFEWALKDQKILDSLSLI